VSSEPRAKLSAPRIDSVNTFEAPATVAPTSDGESAGDKLVLDLAPQSVTVVALEMGVVCSR
jgi:alpha-N-arabinofuranosidase